jgi:hypothetical protein
MRNLPLIGLLAASAVVASCGGYFYGPTFVIPANYATFLHETDSATDYSIFDGSYNPTGIRNGSGNNVLYYRYFFPVAAPGPSTLVGTTWVGRMGDIESPQLKLRIVSATQLDVTLDCYFSGTNILFGAAPVSLPVILNGNTILFTQVFRIVNTSMTDIYTFCGFKLNTNNIRFSTDTGVAAVRTSGGILLGSFTEQ